MESSDQVSTYVVGSDEKYYADLSRPVNIVKFSEMQRIVQELEIFRGFHYPENIVNSYESATIFNLPLPVSGSASPTYGGHGQKEAGSVVDYTPYVMTHLKEWALTYLLEDKVLDKLS